MIKMKKLLVFMGLFILMPVTQAGWLVLSSSEEVYTPGDEILVYAEVRNNIDERVEVIVESSLRCKTGGYVAMPQVNFLTLDPLEKKRITICNVKVEPSLPSGEYIISVNLLRNDQSLESKELSFNVKDTLKEMTLEVYACRDKNCLEKTTLFKKGEIIYLVHESDVSNLEVTSRLTYPGGITEEVNLPAMIDAGEIGTYILDVEAVKKGYLLVEKTCMFAVIEKEVEIENASVCNENRVCDPGENHKNCPQDCPSGSPDRYCDKISDGVCDPDCVEQGISRMDPDCMVETTTTSTETMMETTISPITTTSSLETSPECGNTVCEYLMGETHLTCKVDCPSGGRDNYCDGVKDNVCDPDCDPESDVDCKKTELWPYISLLVALIILIIAIYRRRQRV